MRNECYNNNITRDRIWFGLISHIALFFLLFVMTTVPEPDAKTINMIEDQPLLSTSTTVAEDGIISSVPHSSPEVDSATLPDCLMCGQPSFHGGGEEKDYLICKWCVAGSVRYRLTDPELIIWSKRYRFLETIDQARVLRETNSNPPLYCVYHKTKCMITEIVITVHEQ